MPANSSPCCGTSLRQSSCCRSAFWIGRLASQNTRASKNARARALHYDLHPLVDAAFAETNPVPAKWIMHRMGLLPSAHARIPLSPLAEATQAKVLTLLEQSPHVELGAAA